MAIEKTIIIRTDTSEAVKGVDKLNDSIKETNKDVKQTSETTKVLGSELDKATNGAIGKFKGLVSVVKTTIKGFKGLQVAIASTGLGLLLIALVSIKSAFTGSEEGQNKFAKLMGVIGAVTGNVIDLLADLGDLIIKTFTEPKKVISDLGQTIKTYVIDNVNGVLDGLGLLGEALKKAFSGDFKGALKDAGEGMGKIVYATNPAIQAINGLAKATSNFTKEQIREGKLAADVANKRAKADKLQRELLVDRADLENKIAQLRLKSREEEKFGVKERKQALIDAQALEDQLLTKETEVLELRRDAIKLENTFSRSNKENLDAEAEAIAKVTRQQAIRTNAQRATQRELNTLNKKLSGEAKQKAKEEEDRVAKEIEDNEKRLKAIEDLRQKYLESDKDLDAKTREEKLALERERAEEDLANLIGTETEKREAKIALDALYDQKENELKTIVDEENKLKKEKEDADKLATDKIVKDTKEKELRKNYENLQTILSVGGKKLEAVSKALAIADITRTAFKSISEAISNTTIANTSAIAVSPLTGGQPFVGLNTLKAGLSIGATVASSAKSIQAITSGSKTVSGGTPTGGGGGGGSVPPPPAFNLVGGSGVNQIQDSLQEEQAPIQAFVVGSEVTNQQEIDNAQASSARLG